MQRQSTPEERFWARVDRNGPIPEHCLDLGACWLWAGAKNKHGYGQFRIPTSGRSRIWLAHRISYVMTYGAPPMDRPCVLHRCDNPSCVRPDHLFPGTRRDNMIDMTRKGRRVYPSLSDHSRKMIEDFVSGRRTVSQIAAFYGRTYENVHRLMRSRRAVQFVGALTGN